MKASLLGMTAALSAVAAPTTVWVGSAPPAQSGAAGGIYRATFDPSTATLGSAHLAAPLTSAGFLALSARGDRLYAVDEGAGRVHAFAVGHRDALSPLNSTATGGQHPCHVALSPDARWLAVANYSGGSIALFSLRPDGSIGDRTLLHQPVGRGPHPQRQRAPHAHSVAFTRDGRWLLAADLGLDVVWLFSVRDSHWDLSPSPLRLPPGAGPRQTAFSPDERSLYVVNELDSTVAVFAWTDGPVASHPRQIRTLLPPGHNSRNTAAAIAVSPDGNTVFASNRGHDSIACFTRDPATGDLTGAPAYLAPLRQPRHFTATPDGRHLLVGEQAGGVITAFPVHRSEAPARVPQRIAVPAPTCVLFCTAPSTPPVGS